MAIPERASWAAGCVEAAIRTAVLNAKFLSKYRPLPIASQARANRRNPPWIESRKLVIMTGNLPGERLKERNTSCLRLNPQRFTVPESYKPRRAIRPRTKAGHLQKPTFRLKRIYDMS